MDKDLIADIAEKCSFSTMKKEKDPMENKAEWKDGQPGMYRKGEFISLDRRQLERLLTIKTCFKQQLQVNSLFLALSAFVEYICGNVRYNTHLYCLAFIATR